MRITSRWSIAAVGALTLMVSASTSLGVVIDSTVFGSDNDGVGGFTHTAIDGSNTFQNVLADSVQYRNQDLGTIDAGFIKQQTGINRTPGSGLKYTVTGTVYVSDGYADDNNRIGMILFTDPSTVLSRANTGQIGIVWNTDDSSANNGDGLYTGNDADDNFSIGDKYETPAAADASVPAVLRNQTTAFAQDLLQGTEITWSASFWFTGTNINIDASMTDAGGVTTIGTAVVPAADYAGDYFGFVSAYRARNYDGDPDPNGAARDNPLVMDYKTFTVIEDVIPEPATISLLGLLGGGMLFIRRRFRM